MKEKGAHFYAEIIKGLQSEEAIRSSGCLVCRKSWISCANIMWKREIIYRLSGKLKDALIVGVKGSRFAMGNEIADQIQV